MTGRINPKTRPHKPRVGHPPCLYNIGTSLERQPLAGYCTNQNSISPSPGHPRHPPLGMTATSRSFKLERAQHFSLKSGGFMAVSRHSVKVIRRFHTNNPPAGATEPELPPDFLQFFT